MPRNARSTKELLDYHRAFRRHAQAVLPEDQFQKLHQSAMSIAGGVASGQARQARRAQMEADKARATKDKSATRKAHDPIAALIEAALYVPDPHVAALVHKALEPDAAEEAEEDDALSVQMPILGVAEKQILYCVALEPDTVDLQGDIIDAAAIEATAHAYMENSQQIHAMHEGRVEAHPVESFIAPQDLEYKNGTFGDQVVKRGSWVLGIRVVDSNEWAKVTSGQYTGISVGGYGLRIPVEDDEEG